MKMTFKGMLKIVMNDYKAQHDAKMLTVVNELLQTRRELEKVREQLRVLQVNSASSSSETSSHSEPLLNLPVEYNGQTRELRELPSRMATSDLLIQLRRTFDIPLQQAVQIRVLSDDGLNKRLYFNQNSDKFFEFKRGMTFHITDDYKRPVAGRRPPYDRSKSVVCYRRTYSCESDV